MKQGPLSLKILAILGTVMVLGLGMDFADAAKGGGGKVSVTAAEPGSANQGEEIEVLLSGDGFDTGSTATFYVTGTSDDTQIIVDSTTFDGATGKLKANIRVNGGAQVTDYDIEVRNSRGRRGKGTTLFKVQSVETACTGQEDPTPAITYLTGFDTSGEYDTQDIYLSSSSGCDRYLLLEDAVVKVPGDVYNGQHEPGAYLLSVRSLRLDVKGDLGVVTWRDAEVAKENLYALLFDISPSGTVTVDASGPAVIFVAPSGAEVQPTDVRFNAEDQLELLVLEGHRVDGQLVERRLVYVNATTMQPAVVLMAGDCPVQDTVPKCFAADAIRPWWNEDGSQVFVQLSSGSPDFLPGIGRLRRVSDIWQPAEVLMTHESQVTIIGVRSDGLLAYEWLHYVPRRNGRTNFKETQWVFSSIDPELCASQECEPADGDLMAVDETRRAKNWTRQGGLLFTYSGPGAQTNIGEFVNPFTGEIGRLEIQDVDRTGRDTTYCDLVITQSLQCLNN